VEGGSENFTPLLQFLTRNRLKLTEIVDWNRLGKGWNWPGKVRVYLEWEGKV